MKKKFTTVILSLCLIATMVPFSAVEVSAATTPAPTNDLKVTSRLNQLANTFTGRYFTTNGKPASLGTIYRTTNWSVLTYNQRVRNLNKKVLGGYRPTSSKNLPSHYQCSSHIPGVAVQCMGFANYAMWFSSSSRYTDKIRGRLIKMNIPYTYSNMKKYLRPGDIMGFAPYSSNGSHYVHSCMVISVGKKGVKVIDANIRNLSEPSGMNRVRVHTWYWGDPKKVSITRATNHRNYYKVSYNANGGKGSMASTTVTYGVYRKLSANKFTRTGYAMKGWYVKKTSSNKWLYTNGKTKRWYTKGKQPKGYQLKVYPNGIKVGETSSVNGDTIKLYAKWVKIVTPTNLNYPSTLSAGDSFTFKGKLSSIYTMDKVELGIVKESNLYWVFGYKVTDTGNYRTYDINEKTAGKLDISTLPAGSYYYLCNAYVNGKKIRVFNYKFKINPAPNDEGQSN